MENNTRYIVQINVEGKGWEAYKKGPRASVKSSLTSGEAFAFMATLPAEATNYKKETFSCEYRVIKSVKADGLINQEVIVA